MRIRLTTAALVFVLTLFGCAQMGMQPADTFNKKIGAAYVTAQTIAETAAYAERSGQLGGGDVANIIVTGRAAIAALDVAVQVHATNPASGDAKLTATLAILTALQAYLLAQGITATN